jgi:hypothetical protein
MGGAASAESIWDDQFDSTRRLRVINTYAALANFGLWDSVTSIGFLRVNTRRRVFRVNVVETESDNRHGWELAITTRPEIRLVISEVCPGTFSSRSRFNHPEASWSLLQKGGGIVMHMLGLRPPSEQFTTLHFDGGGGRFFNRQHLSDYWSSNGPTQERVMTALLREPAGEYLRSTVATEVDFFLDTK